LLRCEGIRISEPGRLGYRVDYPTDLITAKYNVTDVTDVVTMSPNNEKVLDSSFFPPFLYASWARQA
jgi:hypothetical protein